MREFDSAGLRTLRHILQTSSGPPQNVDLQDELIQQSLNVVAPIRRDLSPGGLGGLFTAKMFNGHGGSDTVTVDVNPYTLAEVTGVGFIGNGYPLPVEQLTFDVWLLAASAQTITGSGDFGGGFAGLISGSAAMGWRRGSASSVAIINPFALYDQEVTYGNRVQLSDGAAGGHTLLPRPFRIGGSADVRIRFETVKAGAGAASYELDLLLGVWPASLGQDYG